MPKKSKWLDVEFAPADFYNPNNVTILIEALSMIEEAAYRAMIAGQPTSLLEAIKTFSFPAGCPYWALTCFNLTYEFNQALALASIAELLWYLHAPSTSIIKATGTEKISASHSGF